MRIQKPFWGSWVPETEWEAKYLIDKKRDWTMFLHGFMGYCATIFALTIFGICLLAKFHLGGF
jgi:hypothetical protein